jgi:hypothetical protein
MDPALFAVTVAGAVLAGGAVAGETTRNKTLSSVVSIGGFLFGECAA